MEDQNITKAEIQAMLEVQAKSAEHLAIIARSLQEIVTREEKIQHRLYNGLGKELTEAVCNVLRECDEKRNRDVGDAKKIVEAIQKDTTFIKWLYTGLFALVAFAWLVLKIIEHLVSRGGTPL